MSQYAVAADLYALGLPSAALAGVSAGAVEAALVAASGTADGYLAKRFALPLVEWGDDLTSAVCRLAAADLLTTRGTRPGDGVELVVTRQEQAIQWLRDVSRGLVEPQGVVDSTPTHAEDHPLLATSDAVFTVGDATFG